MGMTAEEYEIYISKEQSHKGYEEIIQVEIPLIYRGAELKNIDKRIIDFMGNKNNFAWIYGKAGTGKTYSLYALSCNKINERGRALKIVKEYNIKFDEEYKTIQAIDDMGLSNNENRNKYLLDWYFVLIDHILENDKKLLITSNLTISEWIDNMKRINGDTAMRIASRLSNTTDFITLQGQDRRRVK